MFQMTIHDLRVAHSIAQQLANHLGCGQLGVMSSFHSQDRHTRHMPPLPCPPSVTNMNVIFVAGVASWLSRSQMFGSSNPVQLFDAIGDRWTRLCVGERVYCMRVG